MPKRARRAQECVPHERPFPEGAKIRLDGGRELTIPQEHIQQFKRGPEGPNDSLYIRVKVNGNVVYDVVGNARYSDCFQRELAEQMTDPEQTRTKTPHGYVNDLCSTTDKLELEIRTETAPNRCTIS